MFQIRFHGRGGQGVVTAAEMLSVAAFQEGKHAQAFPSFGSERMGAPVVSFCRIDDREIRLRDPVFEPDALIIQDPTLLQSSDLFKGLRSNGFVLINSSRDIAELGLATIVDRLPRGHILTVPATELALKHFKRPLPNAAMLGGLAALAGIIKLESVAEAITETFAGAIGKANVAAASEAYDCVMVKRKALAAIQQKEAIAC
jgi:pyruvate ferredoxin oxidoreductase gamma subunit